MRIFLWVVMFGLLPFLPVVSMFCLGALLLHSAYLATPAMEEKRRITEQG